jgi:hypothetical protein
MLSVTDRKLVSTDFHHATNQTTLQQGSLLTVLQVRPRMGFSHRMLAPAAIIAAQGRLRQKDAAATHAPRPSPSSF